MDEIFYTRYYRVIEVIYDASVNTKTGCCRLTQEEIAEEVGCTRPLVSEIITKLTSGNYIERLPKSRWRLTDKTEKFLILSREAAQKLKM